VANPKSHGPHEDEDFGVTRRQLQEAGRKVKGFAHSTSPVLHTNSWGNTPRSELCPPFPNCRQDVRHNLRLWRRALRVFVVETDVCLGSFQSSNADGKPCIGFEA
jgi:hypothetical protein